MLQYRRPKPPPELIEEEIPDGKAESTSIFFAIVMVVVMLAVMMHGISNIFLSNAPVGFLEVVVGGYTLICSLMWLIYSAIALIVIKMKS